jgi:hypothetical protein
VAATVVMATSAVEISSFFMISSQKFRAVCLPAAQAGPSANDRKRGNSRQLVNLLINFINL